MLSLVPSVSASHITDYAVQRDPSFISIGDIDCDDDNDIVSAGSMGHFITALYNDGNGGFGDRRTSSYQTTIRSALDSGIQPTEPESMLPM